MRCCHVSERANTRSHGMRVCRFSWPEMMKLRDGLYAFGLLATIDGVQLTLAVSKVRHAASARAPVQCGAPAVITDAGTTLMHARRC